MDTCRSCHAEVEWAAMTWREVGIIALGTLLGAVAGGVVALVLS